MTRYQCKDLSVKVSLPVARQRDRTSTETILLLETNLGSCLLCRNCKALFTLIRNFMKLRCCHTSVLVRVRDSPKTRGSQKANDDVWKCIR
jgi:hypothetical protein